jgi:A/G-specific adenine glycosylase
MSLHRATKSEPGEGCATGALLAWYDRNRRDLAWRAAPGAASDPFAVWVSEIMLQQTTVAAVLPYYRRFLARWPTVGALARANIDEVLHLWQGLGYYARARNLHRAAQTIVATRNGRIPDTESELQELPGIGRYTAAAIAAIAFGRRAAAIDANAERVIARLFAVAEPLPQAKNRLRDLASALVPPQRPGDFAQALMDLGALVCLPRTPQCGECPLHSGCLAAARGLVARLPQRAPKRERPVRYGTAYWISDGENVLLRRRPARGLLGGLMEVPNSGWSDEMPDPRAPRHAAVPARCWRQLPVEVRHGFTHFELVLRVWAAHVTAPPTVDGVWWPIERLHEQALPTLMKKVVSVATAEFGKSAAARIGQPPSSTAAPNQSARRPSASKR